MTPEERIRELAKKSSIGASDAARLLAAVKTEPLPLERRFDPFTRISALTGTLVGIGASVAGVGLGQLGIRFAGLLDVHKSGSVVPVQRAALDQIAAFVLAALVFWGVGYALARRGRAVDMFSTVGLARLPVLVFTLPIALLGDGLKSGHSLSMLGWLFALVILIGTALQLYLLVVGFKTATGLSGSRFVFGIVGALIGAEIVSKIFIALV